MAKPENAAQYIEQHSQWKNELERLRSILLSFDLEEIIKWGAPVYMYEGKNLVSIAAFKNHYALWFFQGGLLRENTALLTNAQEGKTQAMRQIKFEKGDSVDIKVLSEYFEETIKLAKEGKTMKQISPTPESSSKEIKDLIEKDDRFKEAFFKLSPGRQKEYNNYIAEAKREETKMARLKKIIPLIKEGKGLNDKYRTTKNQKDQ